ncbi:hypothetical protein [Bordetella bronchiseptica]|uniref:hypothetical protein n=1 Tax=Bordetella bronchiseptica TaxID=518 RepID=UPI000FDAFF89|nr:hypothetical protein [Bordetella bronchiseptica]
MSAHSPQRRSEADRRSANYNALRRWIGNTPPHGEALGLPSLVEQGSRLLSGRMVAEIEAMLNAMKTLGETHGATQLDEGLAPPGYNWELRSTKLWRFIDKNHAALKKIVAAEPWEFVAAYALHRIRIAVQTLRQEPIGLGLSPLVAGTQAQQATSIANQWLNWARAESQWKNVVSGQKHRAGGIKGNVSRERKNGVSARRQQISQEAAKLLAGNPRRSTHDIAQELARKHRGERGWSVSTITSVLNLPPEDIL